MYICGEVFYGIPLHFDGYGHSHSDFMNNIKENRHEASKNMDGLHTFYHGGADEYPLAFGIQFDGFDTCGSFYELDLNTFSEENLQKHKAAFDVLWNKLDETTQKEFLAYGEPRLFVLWSSS
jgi:hypothetical protein